MSWRMGKSFLMRYSLTTPRFPLVFHFTCVADWRPYSMDNANSLWPPVTAGYYPISLITLRLSASTLRPSCRVYETQA